MRLSEDQRRTIRAAVLASDPDARVYLYGSRADDRLKGGDIDLLVLTDRLHLGDKLDLLATLKMTLGDQRIDLMLRSSTAAQNDPFVADILRSAQQV